MIFISYRRADSESVVGHIYSELKKRFPADQVFLDHESILLGNQFSDAIRKNLSSSKFALILIGPQWCSIKDEVTGQRRLDDPNDFVWMEVETALATPGVDVIPIWVMRATTSSEEIALLPPSLQPLFRNQGMSLRPIPDEDRDFQHLIERLSKIADRKVSAAILDSDSPYDEPTVKHNRAFWYVVSAALVILLALGIWSLQNLTAINRSETRFKGKIDVLVERKGIDERLRHLRLNVARALPLRKNDRFRIECKVDPPAYLYVFWVDPGHDVTPVYPWDPTKGWGSRPATEERIDSVKLPRNSATPWYTAKAGKPGVVTVVLLARPTPLDVSDDVVRQWFEGLPELPLPIDGEEGVVWFDDYSESKDSVQSRGFEVVETVNPFAQWHGQLQKALGDKAKFQTAVGFARTSEN